MLRSTAATARRPILEIMKRRRIFQRNRRKVFRLAKIKTPAADATSATGVVFQEKA
jgi:hypothetical protein